MIDTHSHIYSEEFDADRAEVIARAKTVGVEHVVLANVDSATLEPMRELVQAYPDFCSMAVGLHPTSVTADYHAELERVESDLKRGGYVAIGEIGIDLYWDETFKLEQIRVFEQQLQWSIDYQLPVIIHTRKAFAEVFASLSKFKGAGLRGVFHCFGGGIEEAKKAVSLGFLLGIGGVVTYKNSHLSEILREIGVDSLLLETDAPYLSPVPYRGKRNEPQYMLETVRTLSTVFQLSVEKIDEITTKNAKKLFNIR